MESACDGWVCDSNGKFKFSKLGGGDSGATEHDSRKFARVWSLPMSALAWVRSAADQAASAAEQAASAAAKTVSNAEWFPETPNNKNYTKKTQTNTEKTILPPATVKRPQPQHPQTHAPTYRDAPSSGPSLHETPKLSKNRPGDPQLAANKSSSYTHATASRQTEDSKLVEKLQEDLVQAKVRGLKKIKAQEAELDALRLSTQALTTEKAALQAQLDAARTQRNTVPLPPMTPKVSNTGAIVSGTPATYGVALPSTVSARRDHLLHERVSNQARELALERGARAEAERVATAKDEECMSLRNALSLADLKVAELGSAKRLAESKAVALGASLKQAMAKLSVEQNLEESVGTAALQHELKEAKKACGDAEAATAEAVKRAAEATSRAVTLEETLAEEEKALAAAKAQAQQVKDRARSQLESMERKLAEAQKQLAKARAGKPPPGTTAVHTEALSVLDAHPASGLSAAELEEAEVELRSATFNGISTRAGMSVPLPPKMASSRNQDLLSSVDEQIAHDLHAAASIHARLECEIGLRVTLEDKLVKAEAELEQLRSEHTRLVQGSSFGEKNLGNLEYLRNILVRFIEMPETENESLLQVLATILQFSKEDNQRVSRARLARAQGFGGGLGLRAMMTPLRSLGAR